MANALSEKKDVIGQPVVFYLRTEETLPNPSKGTCSKGADCPHQDCQQTVAAFPLPQYSQQSAQGLVHSEGCCINKVAENNPVNTTGEHSEVFAPLFYMDPNCCVYLNHIPGSLE